MLKCKLYIFYLLLFATFVVAQNKKVEDEYYNIAIEAFNNSNLDKAETYFEKSIREYETPASYFYLAKVNLLFGSHVQRAKALRLLKKSVWKDPDNLEYRMAFAELLEDFSKFSAIDQYKQIVEMDTSVSQAWLNLAEIKRKEFDEFYNSVSDMGSGIYAPLDEYALEDFDESEYYYKKAIVSEPENKDVLLKLAVLYEQRDSLSAAINILERLVDLYPSHKEGHLYLGLCYNYENEYMKAHEEFKKAVSLMSYDERIDFTYNSVIELIEPVFNGLKEIKEKWYVQNVIDAYWKMNDPLNEKGINERLVEHYARVAYSNLHFSVEKMGVVGWKSDRGQTIVRYGIPRKKVRMRPIFGGKGIFMKTEVWNYDDLTFAFTDQFSSGNYQYSSPTGEKSRFASHFGGDSHTYAQNVKRLKHQNYQPDFLGEPLDIEYEFIQFRNPDKKYSTDVYLIYSYTTDDSICKPIEAAEHIGAVNYFDAVFEPVLNEEYEAGYTSVNNMSVADYTLSTSILGYTLQPDSGLFNFKVKRKKDNSGANIIERVRVKDFVEDQLEMSDIIFARSVNGVEGSKSISRGDYNIVPITNNYVGTMDENFIYYEIYNLGMSKNNLTDYVVEVKIKDVNEGGFLGDLVSVFEGAMESIGMVDENSITLSGNYQSAESDQNVYLQLDLSQLAKGDYSLSINVKDNLSGKQVTSSAKFTLN